MNERLKMIRKAKHMTQTELAEIFGEIKNNRIVPEILNWYHPPEE